MTERKTPDRRSKAPSLGDVQVGDVSFFGWHPLIELQPRRLGYEIGYDAIALVRLHRDSREKKHHNN